MTIRPVLFLTVLMLITVPSWAIDIRISDSRANNFYMDALTWVLEKSGADYQLINTEHSASSQVRKIELVQKAELDVMYAGTTTELEQQLQAIRYPITRGIIGSRIFIINKDYQEEFSRISGIEDLKKYTGVLGLGWADKGIFEMAGLKYVERVYSDIFQSINLGSRYYFSRGILEAHSELIDKKESMPNLAVENSILLRYKSAVLFFINTKNEKLRAILNTGFKKGYADGSYQAFLFNHPLIKKSFETTKLEDRLVIDIPNPLFPKETAAIASQYWQAGQ